MISEDKTTYHQIIPVNKDVKVIISCLSLLGAATILLYYTIIVIFNGNLETIGIIIIPVGLVFTLFVVYKAFVILIWNLTGKEIISVDDHALLLRREVFGIVRNHTYDIAYISDFSRLPSKETVWSNVPLEFKDKCTLSFSYDGKKKYFGYNLDNEMAEQIFIELMKHIGNKRSTLPNQHIKLTQ